MYNCKYRQNDKWLFGGIWLISIIAIIIIHNPAQLYFLNDDFIYIPQSQGGNFLYGNSFRPVSDILLWLDFKLYGQQAWGYHVTNLLIHFACVFCVYRLTRKILSFFRFETPFYTAHLVAILFMFYAFHSESVFWIIGRGGSLVTIFFAVSLSMMLQEKTKNWQLVLALFCFVMGILTYESIWVLPVTVTMVAYYKHTMYHVSKSRLIKEVSLFWAVLLASFIIRKLMINDFVGTPYHYSIFSFAGVRGMIYQYSTGFFRSFLFPASPSYFVVASCIMLLVFLVFLLMGLPKKWFGNIDLFLGVNFLCTLAPIALLSVNTHNSESERYLYLPSVFVCIFFVIHITRLKFTATALFLYAVLFAYHLFFLLQSAEAYKVAGNANKVALQQIKKKSGNYDIVHVINLPSQYRGGYMFRIGLEYAVKWICPDLKYNKMIVYSFAEYEKPVTIIPVATLPSPISSFMQLNRIVVHPKNDLLIAWNNGQLYIQ